MPISTKLDAPARGWSARNAFYAFADKAIRLYPPSDLLTYSFSVSAEVALKHRIYIYVLLSLISTLAAGQPQYKVLHSFMGGQTGDGASPYGTLAIDAAGNLYGTTLLGGTNANAGTVFEVSPQVDGSWVESVIYNFCSAANCGDGQEPQAGLTIDSHGNLYGTTLAGGTNCPPNGTLGCGVVFELSPPQLPGGAWTENVLHNLCSVVSGQNCLDGYNSLARVKFDALGNLYGTTLYGGTGDGGRGEGSNGVVFELSPTSGGQWVSSVLYNFCPSGHGKFCTDGTEPRAGVTVDPAGNVYGTTSVGGATGSAGGGVVYKLSPGSNGWTQTILYSFRPPYSSGATPLGEVRLDSQGNLYSTTSTGGQGAGTVFQLNSSGQGRQFTFDGFDGGAPSAGVLLDSTRRALFGTTALVGAGNGGTVYEILGGHQSTLYNFCSQSGCADGGTPLAGLVEDASGNLYGTTNGGGINNQGVVFEITP